MLVCHTYRVTRKNGICKYETEKEEIMQLYVKTKIVVLPSKNGCVL